MRRYAQVQKLVRDELFRVPHRYDTEPPGGEGARKVGRKGVLVMTGLALARAEHILGLLHQEYWR